MSALTLSSIKLDRDFLIASAVFTICHKLWSNRQGELREPSTQMFSVEPWGNVITLAWDPGRRQKSNSRLDARIVPVQTVDQYLSWVKVKNFCITFLASTRAERAALKLIFTIQGKVFPGSGFSHRRSVITDRACEVFIEESALKRSARSLSMSNKTEKAFQI